MKIYTDELIPEAIDQRERDYPEWARSLPRLKVKAGRLRLKIERLDAQQHELYLGSLLLQLEAEGPHPVYDAMLADHRLDIRALEG